MNFLAALETKRDGKPLTPRQIEEIVVAYTAGKIPEYQMAAFLMAVYFRGLNKSETRSLTLAMRDSGEVLKFPRDPRPLVDKHSTGGVGDKVSLPLAPLLACLGFRVPMISGRGLGITGGTLDKLESIPGFKTGLSQKQIFAQVQKVGCVICSQTENMVPADKKLYALRDVTGTVPSIPLITASILSKKLAENLDALVLDVKFGSAAFMQEKREAKKLAQAMISLGNECGTRTRAVLTGMSTPLGRAAGNWLEVKESVACLENRGPEDLKKLVIELAAHLLCETRLTKNLPEGRRRATDCLLSGDPKKKWNEMLRAQGANLAAFEKKLAADGLAAVTMELKAPKNGVVKKCDARVIGGIVRDLGGGRVSKESVINFDVGIDRIAKPGDTVTRGSCLARIHAASQQNAGEALRRLGSAFEIARR